MYYFWKPIICEKIKKKKKTALRMDDNGILIYTNGNGYGKKKHYN